MEKRLGHRRTVRLWAVDIDAHGKNEAATVLVMGTDVHDALKAVEHRFPELMHSGSKGKAHLCEHAIYRPATGRFEYKRLRAF